MVATTKLEANNIGNSTVVEAKDTSNSTTTHSQNIIDPTRMVNHTRNSVLSEMKNNPSNQRADKFLFWLHQEDISTYEEGYETQSIVEDLKQSGIERINLICIQVGEITGRYVNIPQLRTFTTSKSNRKQIPNSTIYHDIQELNNCNADGYAYARALFGPRGKLRAGRQSDKQNYRGPWGKELEKSPVLVIQLLLVEKDFRRQGVARLLINSAIEEAKARSGKNGEKGKIKFVATFPSVVRTDFAAELEGKTEEEKEAIEKREYDNAVAFYRAFGFRRIGMSKWFGFALDEEHPSRQVGVEDDLGG